MAVPVRNLGHISRLITFFGSRNTDKICQRCFTTTVKNLPLSSESEDILKSCNYDIDYICDPKNYSEIELNIKNRKGIGNILQVHKLWNGLNQVLLNSQNEVDDQAQRDYLQKLLGEFNHEISQIPNKTHPDVIIGDESKARLVKMIGEKRDFKFHPKTFEDLASTLDILVTNKLGYVSENSSYLFRGDLANLEQALVQFTIDKLCKAGFTLMSVPDLLYPSIIKKCGMMIKNDDQIYFLDPEKHGDVCLAGTSEMALAGYFMNKCLNMKDLPQKLAAVSRCYRCEFNPDAAGIYRVHEFTKVEMFAVVGALSENDSDETLKEIVEIQKELFSDLQLHYRILDMPSQELGASAFRKYDIEAYMPGRAMFGEISSASNCTDYQSRRLNITFKKDQTDKKHFVHTLNGTACAIPRMLIALLETHQESNGSIKIVKALQPYFGQDFIKAPQKKSSRHWIKIKHK